MDKEEVPFYLTSTFDSFEFWAKREPKVGLGFINACLATMLERGQIKDIEFNNGRLEAKIIPSREPEKTQDTDQQTHDISWLFQSPAAMGSH